MEVTDEELECLHAQFRKRMKESGMYPRHHFKERLEAAKEKARMKGLCPDIEVRR